MTGYKNYTSLLSLYLIILACISGCQDNPGVVDKPGSQIEEEFVSIETSPPVYCQETGQTGISKGLSLGTFSTKNFAGSGQCAVCHQNLVDNTGEDVSMVSDWRSTMMANAAKDPLWQAKVSSEIARNPDLQAVIEGKCATCHMPMARTQAIAGNIPVGIFDGAFLNPEDGLHTAALGEFPAPFVTRYRI
ncbi:hypothetical protein ACFLUP_00070 [Chloroflexota bacterium]